MSYPYIKLTVRHGEVVAEGTSTARLGYAAHASVSSDGPYGLYAVWEWDGRMLRAAIDPIGVYNLFYYASDHEIIISPSPIQAIAAGAPATPDARALTLFYRIGLCVGEDTPFSQIKVLPPGGTLRWQPGQFEVKGERIPLPTRAITRKQAVEAYIELFRRSMTRCLEQCPHPMVLPLTGGHDSRHILLEMQRQGSPPEHCVTVNGHARGLDNEVLAARQVTQAADVPHRIIDAPAAPLWNALRTLVWGHLCTDEHATMMALGDAYANVPCVLLDGIAGDVFSRSYPQPAACVSKIRQGDFHAAAEMLLQKHERKMGGPLERWFGPDAARAYPREEALAYLAEQIAPFQDEAEPVENFIFWTRTRREIGLSSSAILNRTAGVLCPYLDGSFIRTLGRVPYEVTADGDLHRQAIARAYPRYAHLPYHKDLPPRRAGRQGPRARLRGAARYVTHMASLFETRPARARDVATVLRHVADRRFRKCYVYHLHQLCMQLVQEPGGAKRLLDETGARCGLDHVPATAQLQARDMRWGRNGEHETQRAVGASR